MRLLRYLSVPLILSVPLTVPIAAALAAAAPAALPCPHGGGPYRGPQTALPDAPVLVIDGTPVERSTYRDWLVAYRGSISAQTFARAWRMERAAAERGVELDPDAIGALIADEVGQRVENALEGERARWEEELGIQRRSPEGYRAWRALELRSELLLEKLAAHERKISDARLEREWERVHGPGGKSYEVRQILLRLEVPPPEPGSSPAERRAQREDALAALEKEAQALRARAIAGEDFGALARAHSNDVASRVRDGAPPNGFDPTGWPVAVLEDLDALEPGQVSEPHACRGGSWIFQLVARDVTPLESVRDELRERILAEPPNGDEIEAMRARVLGDDSFEVLPAMWHPHGEDGGPLRDDEPVLRIDGVEIQRGEYAQWLAVYAGETMVGRFVDQWIVEREAARRGIEVTPEAVDARMDHDIATLIDFFHQGDVEEWRRELIGAGRDEETFRREYRYKARMDYVGERVLASEREVTADDVRALWRDRHGPDGRTVDARTIRVDVVPPQLPEDAGEEAREAAWARARDDAQRRARTLRERVAAGEDFAALAERHSDDVATRAAGGRLREPWRAGVAGAAVDAELSRAPAATLTPVVEVDGGYAFFEVLAVTEIPFDAVRESLRAELESQRPSIPQLSAWRNVLVRDVPVEVLPALYR